jgi:hypothetical protein
MIGLTAFTCALVVQLTQCLLKEAPPGGAAVSSGLFVAVTLGDKAAFDRALPSQWHWR